MSWIGKVEWGGAGQKEDLSLSNHLFLPSSTGVDGGEKGPLRERGERDGMDRGDHILTVV